MITYNNSLLHSSIWCLLSILQKRRRVSLSFFVFGGIWCFFLGNVKLLSFGNINYIIFGNTSNFVLRNIWLLALLRLKPKGRDFLNEIGTFIIRSSPRIIVNNIFPSYSVGDSFVDIFFWRDYILIDFEVFLINFSIYQFPIVINRQLLHFI